MHDTQSSIAGGLVAMFLWTGSAFAAGDGGSPDRSSEAKDDDELSVSELESRARERELGGEDYALHELPREAEDGAAACPDVELVDYDGEVIDYNRPIEIHPTFRSRLVRFEKIVGDVAEQVYGRAPEQVVHLGGYRCKTAGGRGESLSEHAFGLAIDVAGFDFGAVDGESAAEPVDGAFEVRLADHWDASEGLAGKHSAFLHRLAGALKRRGPFSGMLGPAYPGHDKVFHFDFGTEFFFRL